MHADTHPHVLSLSTAWTDGDWFTKAMNAAASHYTMYLVRSDASWDSQHSTLLSISNASHLSQEMGAGATLQRASPGISTASTVLPKTTASACTVIPIRHLDRLSVSHIHRIGQNNVFFCFVLFFIKNYELWVYSQINITWHVWCAIVYNDSFFFFLSW